MKLDGRTHLRHEERTGPFLYLTCREEGLKFKGGGPLLMLEHGPSMVATMLAQDILQVTNYDSRPVTVSESKSLVAMLGSDANQISGLETLSWPIEMGSQGQRYPRVMKKLQSVLPPASTLSIADFCEQLISVVRELAEHGDGELKPYLHWSILGASDRPSDFQKEPS
jgi:hypothetical protein